MTFPSVLTPGPTYTDGSFQSSVATYEWHHSLSEVVGALIQAGLNLEFLHEFDYSVYPSHPFLRKEPDGLWRFPDLPGGLPLMFSVRARKPLNPNRSEENE